MTFDEALSCMTAQPLQPVKSRGTIYKCILRIIIEPTENGGYREVVQMLDISNHSNSTDYLKNVEIADVPPFPPEPVKSQAQIDEELWLLSRNSLQRSSKRDYRK